MEKTPKESDPGPSEGTIASGAVAGGLLLALVLAFMVRIGWEFAGLLLAWMAR